MKQQIEYVLVDRLEHGDQMMVPKYLAKKYPHQFRIVLVEEPKVEEPKVEEVSKDEPPKKRTTRKK